MPLPVSATYRLQLRGPDSGVAFTFADAENLLGYLDDLGVSHLYLSPVLTAAPGSSHCYDVTDPTTVSAELGGPTGLARLSAAARARGMGLIVDIVPNHVGVERPQHNRWWWDVLQHGRSSPFAEFFDIDWELGDGRILLPLLGSEDDLARLAVDETVLRLGELVLPIAPGTGGGTGAEVHERQYYRLVDWTSGLCGYRRFFSVSSLAALRQEDRAVFEASHPQVAQWFSHGLVDGLRVDHPDGLADPAGYLTWLRELTGPDAWIVIEKILATGEPLEPSLAVDGTTGYDALREIGGVFIDPAGAVALTALAGPTPESQLKARAANETLGCELDRLHRCVIAAAGSHPALRQALVALIGHIGVYRCDYPGLATVLPMALARTESETPDLGPALLLIVAALTTSTEAATRFQQLCGAVTAKATEDCLFYRDSRLVSLNEVGGDPRLFGVSAAEFHHRAATRLRLWPRSMTTLSTHDTKRGEDVRARIGVLSQVASWWAQRVQQWEAVVPSPDPGTGLFLWQNIFGVWPVDGEITDELSLRLHRYVTKAVREADLHTSWLHPDADFEDRVHRWLDGVLKGPVAGELTELVTQLDPHAQSDALGQKLLALTVPGIPDIYQGTELWEDSLVDPDNRRPVDYRLRRAELKALQHPKIRVVVAALRSRRARPASYRCGAYRPALAAGTAADHLVGFGRGDDVLVAVTRWSLRLTGWGDTVLPLPDGTWTDRLTGRRHSGRVPASVLFGELPVALLERD